MSRIKTRETVSDIKMLDRSAVAAEHMRRTAVRARDTAKNLMDDGQITPEEYAGDQMRYAAQNASARAGQQAKQSVVKAKQKALAQNRGTGESDRTSRSASFSGRDSQYGPVNGQRSGRRQGREGNASRMRRRQQVIRTADGGKHTMKQTQELTSGVSWSGTNMSAGRSVKTARNAGGVTIKTFASSLHNTEKAAKAARRRAGAAASMTKKAAGSAYKVVVVVEETVSKAVRVAVSGIRNLVVALSIGGGAAAVMIVVICLIALIVGSCFGIFFTGETENEGEQTMREVIQEINEDYQGKLDAIKAENPHDRLEMTGSRAVWPEVLSVYAVRVTTDPEELQEVATMTEEKKQILAEIFWQMNEISFRTEKSTETVIAETDDGRGNIREEKKTEEKTTLHISVSHRTAEEMAEALGFTAMQKIQLQELLNVDSSMWLAVLYGIYGSDDMIVQVALSQLGCAGGETFWSWYGFGSRVEWCACFVSWCADQCGYIENGIIPKYAGCPNGVVWFKERGQWADNSIEPSPGMIIFYDWDNRGSSGPQDGEADHTGIVVRVENGIVYTVEGNCGETCMELQHAVGDYQILGYGIPNY